MTHRLAANYAKNYCNRTPIVKVIVENVVTCFFGTRCISGHGHGSNVSWFEWSHGISASHPVFNGDPSVSNY